MSTPDAAPVMARPRHARFELAACELDGRRIRLGYRLAGGEDADVELVETLTLPDALPAPSATDPVVRALLDGMHRAFGVSYFKACVPGVVVAPPAAEEDASFWNTLYGEGMGEFWYRNDLDPERRGRFPGGGPEAALVTLPARPERALVLAGGGKDSAVACEIVRHAGVPVDAFSLGDNAWIRRSVEAMGLPHLVVLRAIDPRLFELNRRGAWNGHVPISACIAFLAQLVAHLGGHDAVLVANERSADEGNVSWRGLDVNHQWSKTLRFERAFQAWWQRRFEGGPTYFSILRPLSELRIAHALAQHPRYVESFTSCNTNFRQGTTGAAARWCGRCPKCVFVALMLAPHVSDATVETIFGRDLLAEPENLAMLEALVGVRGQKPFECVGTPDESLAALARLAEQDRLTAPARALLGAAPSFDPAAGWAHAMAPSGPHAMPPRWERRLHAYLGSH